MEWVIGAAVAVMPFAVIAIAAIVAIAMRRNNAANSKRKNRATCNGANDEEFC